MKLRYIAIDLDKSSFSDDYCSEFVFRTRFISNFLSKRIRKLRYDTDGTFNMICVEATDRNPGPCAIVPIDVLEAKVAFDRESYEQIKGTQNCEYYLELLEKGFRKAAQCKDVPLGALSSLIDEFRGNGCKNEWLHKKKRIKAYDIEVALNCFFTTLDFRLVASIKRISTKEELCSGVILQTEPDEIFFDREFKDILVDERSIIITNFLDRPRILIDRKAALDKELVFVHLPDKSDDDGNDERQVTVFEIGVIKLYKKLNGAVHYYEAWDDEKRVIVHWGMVGETGESKIVSLRKDETAKDVIGLELALPRSQGYQEIDVDDHRMLVIQYKMESGNKTKDLEKRFKIESLVNERLGWTGNGHCDGGQVGSGTMEVFAYVVDAQVACESLVDALWEKGLLNGAIIAFEGDDKQFVVCYPKDFQGELKIF